MNKIGIYTFDKIDADWFISIFTPLDFMIADLKIYFYFALAVLYLEKVIFNSEISPVKKLISSNLMLFSAFIGTFILLYFKEKPLNEYIEIYALIALSLNGFGVIILSKKLGKMIGVGMILLVPYITGLQHAKKLETNDLPIVELDDNKKWHLLDKHSDQIILINSQDKKNEFKIVDMKELKLLKQP